MIDIGSLVALLLTFSVLSYLLYKETIVFNFTTYTFLGVAIGNVLVIALKTIQSSAITKITTGEYLYIVPIILGLMIYLRLVEPLKEISRLPLALMIGTGVGLSIASLSATLLVVQTKVTIEQLFQSGTIYNKLGAWVTFFAVITCLIYFQFTSYYDKPILSKVRNVARMFLMVAFGAQFGAVVLTRLTTLVGQIYFIVSTLGLT